MSTMDRRIFPYKKTLNITITVISEDEKAISIFNIKTGIDL